MNNKNNLVTEIKVKEETTEQDEQNIQSTLKFVEIFIKEEHNAENINYDFLNSEKVAIVESSSFDYQNKLQECQPYSVKEESNTDENSCDNPIIINSGKEHSVEVLKEKQIFQEYNYKILTQGDHSDEIPIISCLNKEDISNKDDKNCVNETKNSNIYINEYRCEICKTTFKSKRLLKIHILTHLDKRNKCSKCYRSFDYPKNLKRHLEQRHGIVENVCHVCGKSFCRKSVLNKHLLHHDAIKKYSCDICNCSFSHKSNVNQHLMTHNKRFLCDICNKYFATRSYITKHMESHTNKRVTCNICKKSFDNRSPLYSHMLSHSDCKKLKCKVCGELFKRECGLFAHMTTHSSGDKKFTCHVCGIPFHLSHRLNAHLKSHRMIATNFTCHICSKSFSYQFLLSDHLLTHSETKSYTCEVCNRSFLKQSHLNTHSRIHK